jgi:hypothetical protein
VLKKEYIVFTAFLLVNTMLALNCFTFSTYANIKKIQSNNFKEIVGAKYSNKINFSSTELMLVPDVSAQWNQNDQIQINFSTPSLRNFCIQTILHKTYYKNPDIKECQEIKKADTHFYKFRSTSFYSKIKRTFNSIDEIAINTDYPDDIVFILNNQTYLVIHNSKDNQNTLPSTKIEEADNWVETFLNNKNNTVTRKKINTLLEIKVQSSQEFYLTFLYKENSFRQILTLEWEYKEILKESAVGKFIFLTLVLPLALAGDILLSPITVPLWILFLILWNNRKK